MSMATSSLGGDRSTSQWLVILGAVMTFAGTGITISGQPIGIIILGLGLATWAPFYVMSLTRNIVSLVENNPRAVLALIVLGIAAFVFL